MIVKPNGDIILNTDDVPAQPAHRIETKIRSNGFTCVNPADPNLTPSVIFHNETVKLKDGVLVDGSHTPAADFTILMTPENLAREYSVGGQTFTMYQLIRQIAVVHMTHLLEQ
jgi:hypothetical protein